MFEVLGVQVNIIAIVLAAVANIIVGILWYSDFLFGRQWKRLIGKTDQELSEDSSTMSYILGLAVALLVAIGLNSVLQFSSQVTGLMGLPNIFISVTMIVVTFVLATQLNGVIWEGKRKKLFLLNMAHHYVEYLVMAAVISWLV